MAVRMDFQQTSLTGDLLIQNGDFVIGPSDEQHVSDIIYAAPGWWMEFPQLGVGILNYFGSDGLVQQLTSSVSVQLASDGYNSTPLAQYTPSGYYTIAPNATINQS